MYLENDSEKIEIICVPITLLCDSAIADIKSINEWFESNRHMPWVAYLLDHRAGDFRIGNSYCVGSTISYNEPTANTQYTIYVDVHLPISAGDATYYYLMFQ